GRRHRKEKKGRREPVQTSPVPGARARDIQRLYGLRKPRFMGGRRISFCYVSGMRIHGPQEKSCHWAGISMIYPNVFVMIVGQSTISGKSTVCNMAVSAFGKSIIYEEPVAKFNSTEIHLGTVSAPTLVQNMSYIHNALWYCDECGGLFDQIISWNDELPSNLRKAYDGTPLESKLSNSRRTKKTKTSENGHARPHFYRCCGT